jgi:BTB/POZ domain
MDLLGTRAGVTVRSTTPVYPAAQTIREWPVIFLGPSNTPRPSTMMTVSRLGNPTVLSPVETLRFEICGFAKLELAQGESVTLPSLLAHGCHWTVEVYPRGDEDGGVEEDDDESVDSKVGEYVTIFLQKTIDDLTVDASFTARVGSITRSQGPCTFPANKDAAWGWWTFVKRQELLDKTKKLLDDCGTLVIEVDLQVYVEKSPVWYPPMPIIRDDDSKMLADLLLDDPTSCSDVTFKVGSQEFKLHRFLLATRAPVLFQMITSIDQTITLPDVDADSFRSLVRLMYTGDWSNSFINNANEAKSLLTTANRFGCSRLKLLVESFMVEEFLDASNAADLLLLGESHTCALLKEAAMKICLEQAAVVMVTDGWKRVVESNALMAELFAASHRKQSTGNQADDDTEGQSVAELRDRLLKRGRDVDGSREMLVKRLKAE